MTEPEPGPGAADVRRYLRTDALRLAIKYVERVTIPVAGPTRAAQEVLWPGTVIDAAEVFERYLAGGE